MDRNSLIQVNDLVVGYGDAIVLKHIEFQIFEGEIFGILGGSGSGKSTLLRHLIGLETPFSGKIVIDGVDIVDCSDDQYQQTLRKMGVLFQGAALLGSMTLAENVALPIMEYTRLRGDQLRRLVRMKLCMVDLDGFEDHYPGELSGGMKKRAGLARALALNPRILFLDEPSAGLDPVTQVEIDELIVNINRTVGATIVIVTHELESIFTVAERIVLLDNETKTIIAEGDPRELKNKSDHPVVRRFLNRLPRRA